MEVDAVIEVEGLAKSFGGRRAVEGLDLRVRRGEIFGFLGPNGSGKTTSIRMLCGLLTPDAGEGTCIGYDVIRDAQLIKREEYLIAAKVIHSGQVLTLYSGKRHITLKAADLEHYKGERGRRGNKLPRGFQKVDAVEVADK